MPPTDSKTTNQAAITLTRGGDSWTGDHGKPAGTITFAFRETAPAFNLPAKPNVDLRGTFSKMNAAQISAVTLALDLWSDLANIDFKRVGTGAAGPDAHSNDATMLFGNYRSGSDPAAAFSAHPRPHAKAPGRPEGDVWVNIYKDAHIATDVDLANAPPTNLKPTVGSDAYMILMHEIGHAIGLDHPADYKPGPDFSYDNSAGYREDSQQFTVMSYFPASSTEGRYGPQQNPLFPETPMLHDIAAIQRLYGINRLTRTGDTVYGFNSNADRDAFKLHASTDKAVFAIWDADGTDTLDFSGYFQTTGETPVIDLRPGHFSSVGGLRNNIAVADKPAGASDALDYFIENAIGTRGHDTIYGNERNNRLSGGGGDDRLRGGPGNDTFEGGTGQDELFGHDHTDTTLYEGKDTAVYLGERADYLINPMFGTPGGFEIEEIFGNRDEGTDKLHGVKFVQFSDVKLDLSKLVFTKPPNPGITISGSFDPIVSGGPKNDDITGRGTTHTINGLAGDDVLKVIEPKDASGVFIAAFLNGGDGDDSLTGRGGVDSLSGDAGDDTLGGLGGDDLLEGGIGQDILDGGDGDDALYGQIGSDRLLGDAGADKLRGGPGSDILNGDGFHEMNPGHTAYRDELKGEAGDDRLETKLGPDQLDGGAGIDLAILDQVNVEQEITFAVKPGIMTSLGGGLATITRIERIEFYGGSKDDRATAFNFDDVLAGGGGDDVLNGLDGDDILIGEVAAGHLPEATIHHAPGDDRLDGGAGADVMIGGDGNDRYFVDDPGDLIDESSGDGKDIVFIDSVLPYVLTATSEIEEIRGLGNRLDVRGSLYGNTIFGTDGADIIRGEGGKDTLNGDEGGDTLDGGAGEDVLRGGKGNDIYFVDERDDTVVETAGQGFDTVHFALVPGHDVTTTYALGAKAQVEVLDTTEETLFGLKLVGNNFNNQINGNSRPGTLEGKGGDDLLNGKLGSDDLVGGTGKDTFVFSTAIANGSPPGSPYTNVDTINDFTTFVDKIQLDDVIFANARAAPSHRLLASDFSTNLTSPGNAHLILDKTTGRLFYDPDAGGGALRIHFATVLSGPSPAADLTAFDILLV